MDNLMRRHNQFYRKVGYEIAKIADLERERNNLLYQHHSFVLSTVKILTPIIQILPQNVETRNYLAAILEALNYIPRNVNNADFVNEFSHSVQNWIYLYDQGYIPMVQNAMFYNPFLSLPEQGQFDVTYQQTMQHRVNNTRQLYNNMQFGSVNLPIYQHNSTASATTSNANEERESNASSSVSTPTEGPLLLNTDGTPAFASAASRNTPETTLANYSHSYYTWNPQGDSQQRSIENNQGLLDFNRPASILTPPNMPPLIKAGRINQNTTQVVFQQPSQQPANMVPVQRITNPIMEPNLPPLIKAGRINQNTTQVVFQQPTQQPANMVHVQRVPNPCHEPNLPPLIKAGRINQNTTQVVFQQPSQQPANMVPVQRDTNPIMEPNLPPLIKAVRKNQNTTQVVFQQPTQQPANMVHVQRVPNPYYEPNLPPLIKAGRINQNTTQVVFQQPTQQPANMVHVQRVPNPYYEPVAGSSCMDQYAPVNPADGSHDTSNPRRATQNRQQRTTRPILSDLNKSQADVRHAT